MSPYDEMERITVSEKSLSSIIRDAKSVSCAGRAGWGCAGAAHIDVTWLSLC